MIRIILKGGLGNQMFQYAFGKSLSIKLNEELILDTTFLKSRLPLPNFTFRNYELDLFSIPEKTKSLVETDITSKYFGYPLLLLQKNTLGGKYITEPKELQYIYSPKFSEKAVKGNTYDGYWTNYKYFEENDDEIQKIFDTSKLFDKNFIEIEKEITNSNSVSISIRRGDYLNSGNKDFFVQLNKKYYDKAINLIRNEVKKPRFFVFSYDDPLWAKKNLNLKDSETTFLDKEYVSERFKTYLRLISICKHNIIANSTFAFWGAWLNNNQNKNVICPSKWILNRDFDVPPNWRKIKND